MTTNTITPPGLTSEEEIRETALAQTISRPPRSLWKDAWHRLLRNKAAVLGALVVAFFLAIAALAPFLAPHDPLRIYSGKGYSPPSFVKPPASGDPVFIFGTDYLGRDVFSRVMYGARVSMIVGFVPVTIILIVGISIGLWAGYRGGRTDNLLMRLTDIVYAFPALLFYIIVMTALRDSPLGQLASGMILLFISLALVSWVGCARLVRGQVLSLKRKEFVEAARMIGATDTEILIKHILPNALSPIIVTTAFLIPALIITEATLGYLGLGLRPGTDAREFFVTSWGSMLLEGQPALNSQPWLLAVPALCLAVVVLAFNYLGDGLRDALDPRMAGTD
jgi:oligopeptide transport system permease protein